MTDEEVEKDNDMRYLARKILYANGGTGNFYTALPNMEASSYFNQVAGNGNLFTLF